MSDLVKRLTIKAGVMEMGEKIAWGSDTSLMREAAHNLDVQQARIEALEKAARIYMRGRGHSDGCARLMRSNGSNQCVCGHNALAALLEVE